MLRFLQVKGVTVSLVCIHIVRKLTQIVLRAVMLELSDLGVNFILPASDVCFDRRDFVFRLALSKHLTS